MPPEAWIERIEHVLDAIRDIENHTAGVDEAGFLENRTRHQAVLWCLQIIGEAIHALPADFRDRYPDVEWRAIRSMRNTIVHQYHRVELDVVWHSVQAGLPELKRQMQDLREDLRRRGRGPLS